ncbi:hypothetical protein [Streptomyces sp. bgisy027]|uniref:hypothetical protein n=1 Tax=Streptomyces sp. bgisy027 TaxID=3413770 RepID=UPI003D74EDFF
MRDNLDLTGGLALAEAVMMALAPGLGRQRAHQLVYDARARATETGTGLAEELLKNPDIVTPLGEHRIRRLTDPSACLGSALAMTRSVARRSA